ncbi:Gfo/Idh/MocA family protein [Cellulomonas fimi]|uniref:Oxidoreductase domain protein n=1 Tax=Cellulomonas fimi (strain ATCC 484 / DSM 20113 / JCM 1341 / CCUG 24087 / LMG 16345 / NBRC 15513 / NCIMB 8980 / NCTC 7547 / NRS-133) TaxID=590998 RepID=F4H176_CELFA|nr:Gfo/Idh/MocA family oxidoreductase [Cellulomonas fimi]AEE47445.1 oxidoreductase domain protein [Cellulomonas fimi ATCC 484]NNH05577.1 Gfo/Idh/MocA family oxidoreductase [Cellulomonas fimi]VEH36243.1 putative oxidoreductase [Cellulomonas fimi]
MTAPAAVDLARVAVVGVHGHGASHVRRVAALASERRALLSAVVDPRPVDGAPDVPPGTPWFGSLDELLAVQRPDVVVLSTPIPTHLPLASAALRAGCDVLLEKPTAASLAEHAALLAVVAETGRRCQVGFQTFGSGAVDEVVRIVASGELGDVVGVGAVGTWVRTAAYYRRAAWAGRRALDGVEVVDGVVTNPLAHAVATALLVAGARTVDDVTDVDVDLFHAHPIEADDTSAVVVGTRSGLRVAAGLTLCAPERTPARVLVQGTHGSLTLFYEQDAVEVRSARGTRRISTSRVDLLAQLLDARRSGGALRCDVADTGAFMRVLEAVRTAPDPAPVAPEHVTWRGEGADAWPVVTDVEGWCERVATEARTFTALGAPWTHAT